MKTNKKFNWFVISNIIVYFAVCAAYLVMLFMLLPGSLVNKQVVNSHKFQIGDCITYENPDKESWEQLHPFLVHKIVKIGKHSYKILTSSLVSSINFRDEISYVKVECK